MVDTTADAISAFTCIAFDAFKQSLHRRAIESLTSALNLTPDPSFTRARTLLNRATIYRHIKDFAAASDDAQEALLILQTSPTPDVHLLASVLHCLGEIYANSGQNALGGLFKAKAMQVLCEPAPPVRPVPAGTDKMSDKLYTGPSLARIEEEVAQTPQARTETGTSKSGPLVRRKKLFQKAATGSEVGEVKIARQKTFVNAFADYRRTDGSSLATEKRKIYLSDQNILIEKFRQRAFSFHCDVAARSFEDLYELKTYCRGLSHAVRMRALSAETPANAQVSVKLMLQPSISELKKLQDSIRKPEVVEIRKPEPKRSSFLMGFSGIGLKTNNS